METNGSSGRKRREARALPHLRSWIRYGLSLRVKLVVLVLMIAILVVGALYGFAFVSLRASIASIYEQRARSVAAVISKSIQEKEYILYYSQDLDADIGRLLERYESVVGITVIGASARGFLTAASTDPTGVGKLAGEEDQERYRLLQQVDVRRVRLGGVSHLRADHPIFVGADLVGVVIVDMSLDEQSRHVFALSWQFGTAAIVGVLLLGGLLYIALRGIVTQPVGRLARAMRSVAERKADPELPMSISRVPGTSVRDEVEQLFDGFRWMTKLIHLHEQELRKLVALDELTGVYNLGHLRKELDRELRKTLRYGHPTSLLLLRFDGLEARSPEEREEVLVRTAQFLVGQLRNVDIYFRVGEQRFAALLPETAAAGAAAAAARVREHIPDLAAHFEFPIALSVIPMGWDKEDAAGIDALIDRVIDTLGDLRE